MNDVRRREVIVAGGGVSGLATAWRLRRAGVDVALLEREAQVGGAMRTEARDGLLLEKGPFNVLVRDEAFRELLADCEGDVAPVQAAEEAKARYVLKGGRLHQVPAGPGAMIGSPLLSTRGKLRMLRGMLVSGRSRTFDPTIAEAARRRLGSEVAETLVSSIIAGVFGGDSRELSLRACFPNVWSFDRERLSPLLHEMRVLRARRKAQRSGQAAGPRGLVSFEGGLQALADWMGGMLGDDLLTGCAVSSIERDDDGGWTVRTSRGGEPLALRCRELVLATPRAAASGLLRPVVPEASRVLDMIDGASLVVLNLAFQRRDVGHPMAGYGYLVPLPEAGDGVMGVLWADSAFPHHAPDDLRLIRVFMGGPCDPGAAQSDERELLASARRAIDGLLDIRGEPAVVDVCRWPDAIPQYRLGHVERIERLMEAMGAVPGLHLAGNYLRGVSVNDCVREGAALADVVAGRLRTGEHAASTPDEEHEHAMARPIPA